MINKQLISTVAIFSILFIQSQAFCTEYTERRIMVVRKADINSVNTDLEAINPSWANTFKLPKNEDGTEGNFDRNGVYSAPTDWAMTPDEETQVLAVLAKYTNVRYRNVGDLDTIDRLGKFTQRENIDTGRAP